jgi:hypothetical protein
MPAIFVEFLGKRERFFTVPLSGIPAFPLRGTVKIVTVHEKIAGCSISRSKSVSGFEPNGNERRGGEIREGRATTPI